MIYLTSCFQSTVSVSLSRSLFSLSGYTQFYLFFFSSLLKKCINKQRHRLSLNACYLDLWAILFCYSTDRNDQIHSAIVRFQSGTVMYRCAGAKLLLWSTVVAWTLLFNIAQFKLQHTQVWNLDFTLTDSPSYLWGLCVHLFLSLAPPSGFSTETGKQLDFYLFVFVQTEEEPERFLCGSPHLVHQSPHHYHQTLHQVSSVLTHCLLLKIKQLNKQSCGNIFISKRHNTQRISWCDDNISSYRDLEKTCSTLSRTFSKFHYVIAHIPTLR